GGAAAFRGDRAASRARARAAHCAAAPGSARRIPTAGRSRRVTAYNRVTLQGKPRVLTAQEITDLLEGRGCTVSLEARAVLQRALESGQQITVEEVEQKAHKLDWIPARPA